MKFLDHCPPDATADLVYRCLPHAPPGADGVNQRLEQGQVLEILTDYDGAPEVLARNLFMVTQTFLTGSKSILPFTKGIKLIYV